MSNIGNEYKDSNAFLGIVMSYYDNNNNNNKNCVHKAIGNSAKQVTETEELRYHIPQK